SAPLTAPAPALSGDETKRRMALVNADREIVRKIMTEPGPRPRRGPKMRPPFFGGRPMHLSFAHSFPYPASTRQTAGSLSTWRRLPVDLSPLVLRAAAGCRLCLPHGWQWCRSLRSRLDFGFGELAAQGCWGSRIGGDGSERRAVWPGAIGHQTSIDRDDIPGTQCRIISNGCVDEAGGVLAVAGAAGDDLLPVRERGGKLRVALAVGRDRVVDAVACCPRRDRAAEAPGYLNQRFRSASPSCQQCSTSARQASR